MIHAYTVCCQNCGAPLEVAEALRFVTCAHCGSQLQIVRDASTVHTLVLKEVVGELDAMRTKLKKLEIQREIDLLDREWEREKQSFFLSDKHGGRYEPTVQRGGFEIGLGVLAVAVINLLSMNSTRPDGGAGVLGAILCIVLAISGAHTISKARALEAARFRYQGKRNALLHRMNEACE